MTPAMIAAKNVTPDKKTAFSTACTWYEADSGAEFSDTAVFAEGKQYRAELKLTARADWQFLDSTTYKINGTAAEKDSSSDAAPWEQVTLSRIFTAKPATEGKVITNIQMTIPAPVAGNSPSSCKAQKSDPRYTISYRWEEVDAAGKTISLNVTTFEEGKHYLVCIVLDPNVGYEFEGGGQEAIINGKAYPSYTSPGMNTKYFIEYYVTLTAVAGGGSTGGGTVTPPEPPVTPPSGGGDGGGAVVIVAAAGAVAAGVVGYGVYNYVSGQKLQALLPEGVAAPENRAQTALLLWNTAGRPEPAEAPAFADVADPDTAKAAQWCVEQGLMKRRLNGKFAPGSSIPAYQVLNAYRKLAG